jgi:glycine betaine/proline transport system permease protein
MMHGGMLSIFPDWGTPLRDATNQAVNALVTMAGDRLEAASNGLLAVLVALEQLLQALPPGGLVLATAALGWASSRRLGFALASAAAVWLIGALGQWDQAMQTLALVLVAVALAVAIGLPLGVACARWRGLRRVLLPLLDVMQTIPSFVYLIPAAMLMGLGKVPALLATVVYATPPMVRLTELGLRQVSRSAVEAARAFGATGWQLLTKVQLPLALPSLLQGLNQATMMALAMVVVASMIGARGVGETVLLGLQRNDAGTGLVGGLVIVLLAIVLDRNLQAWGARHPANHGLD